MTCHDHDYGYLDADDPLPAHIKQQVAQIHQRTANRSLFRMFWITTSVWAGALFFYWLCIQGHSLLNYLNVYGEKLK